MEHAEAAPLLTELLAERLQPQAAAAVREHLESCEECRGVSETYGRVRDELASHRQLLGRHPEPDALVAYATGDLGTADIRSHTDGCASCSRELEILRRNGIFQAPARPSWPRPTLRIPASLLRPALAALVLALLYPAYLGVVQLPRLRETTTRLDGEIQSLRREQTKLRTTSEAAGEQSRRLASWGGAVQPLLLQPLRRDGANAAAPALRVAPGQPAVPVLIEDDRFTAPALQFAQVEISILPAEPDAMPKWKHQGLTHDLWSPEAQALVFLVPASVLEAGAYVLTAHTSGPPQVEFQSRFTVVRSTPPPD